MTSFAKGVTLQTRASVCQELPRAHCRHRSATFTRRTHFVTLTSPSCAVQGNESQDTLDSNWKVDVSGWAGVKAELGVRGEGGGERVSDEAGQQLLQEEVDHGRSRSSTSGFLHRRHSWFAHDSGYKSCFSPFHSPCLFGRWRLPV